MHPFFIEPRSLISIPRKNNAPSIHNSTEMFKKKEEKQSVYFRTLQNLI